MPESFIASRSSASSMSLPAVSIAPSSDASVKRRGGWVSLRSDSTDSRLDRLALLELGQHLVAARVVLVGVGRRDLLAVDRAPAGLEQDAAAGAEHVLRLATVGLHARALEDGVGMEDREEALARRGRRSSARRRPSSTGRARTCVGMIAWWSVTFLSLTTRPSGSFSSAETYSAPFAYCGVVPDELGRRA